MDGCCCLTVNSDIVSGNTFPNLHFCERKVYLICSTFDKWTAAVADTPCISTVNTFFVVFGRLRYIYNSTFCTLDFTLYVWRSVRLFVYLLGDIVVRINFNRSGTLSFSPQLTFKLPHVVGEVFLENKDVVIFDKRFPFQECFNESICAPNFLPLFYVHWHKFSRHVTSCLWRGLWRKHCGKSELVNVGAQID